MSKINSILVPQFIFLSQKIAIALLFCLFFVGTILSQPRRKPSGTSKPKETKMVTRQKNAVANTRNILENQSSVPADATMTKLLAQFSEMEQTFGSEDPKVWARQWLYSQQVLGAYYKASRNNLIVAPFSDTMYILFILSYQRRAEARNAQKDKFAKDFVRELFLFASLDIAKRWNYWLNPLTPDEIGVISQKHFDCGQISLGLGLLAMVVTEGNSAYGAATAIVGMEACIFQLTPSTATGFVGQHHFDEHLARGFYKHFREVAFPRVLKENINVTDKALLVEKFKQKIQDIRTEHTKQLEVNAETYDVIANLPKSVANLPGLDAISAFFAKKIIPPRAADLRESMLQTAIVDMREKDEIEPSVASEVLSFLSQTTPSNQQRVGDTFTVGQYLNTRLPIQSGERLQISASGKIRVALSNPIPDRNFSSPSGISDYTTYSLFRKYPHGALLGRIMHNGDEQWELIGSNRQLIAPSSGTLELLVNDGDPTNNSGAYSVTVKKVTGESNNTPNQSKSTKNNKNTSKETDEDKINKPNTGSKIKEALKKKGEKLKNILKNPN